MGDEKVKGAIDDLDLDPEVQMILPILHKGSAFIGITTLDDTGEDNFVRELAETRNAVGDRLCNVIFITRVCDRCRREGIENNCNHEIAEENK